MFDNELSFFIENQKQLVEKFDGKVLLLHGQSVIGAFDTALAAWLAATERSLVPGSYMLQPCVEGAAAYTVTVHSSLSAV